MLAVPDRDLVASRGEYRRLNAVGEGSSLSGCGRFKDTLDEAGFYDIS
jgi:hypothetical protein